MNRIVKISIVFFSMISICFSMIACGDTTYEEKNVIVKPGDYRSNMLWLTSTDRETQFKQVDIIAKKGNEIILIEIEDLESDTKTYGELEYGIGYVELGGILFLSQLYSELDYNKSFIITLLGTHRLALIT